MRAEEFTRGEIAEFLRRADLALMRWRGHSEFEDIRGEANLAVWKRLDRLKERPPQRLLITMVMSAAKWAAADYLRSTRCGRIMTRYYREQGHPAMPILSYDDSAVLAEPPWWDGGIEGVELSIAAGQIWDWVLARATDRQREALIYCFREGLSQQAAAERMGCLQGGVFTHLQRAMNHYRAAHGIGKHLIVDTRRGRSSRPQGQLAASPGYPTGPIAGVPLGQAAPVYPRRQGSCPKKANAAPSR